MYEYLDNIQNILKIIKRDEKQNISKAADMLYNATKIKNSIYIFGASHAGILAQEMYYRAGGLITINAIFAREVMLDREPITFTSKMERLEGYGTKIGETINFMPNDVLILHSVSGRNPIIIDLALFAKRKKVKIIGLTNLKYSKSVWSRHSSGKKLYELSDVILDNHGDIGDASCKITKTGQKVGPTSTVIGAAILNEVVVETCEKLSLENSNLIPVFYSANLDGGDRKNKTLIEKYSDVIHYRF